MELFINQEKVDFSLEGETNLKEVLDNLSKILSQYGHIIMELKVNGEEIDPETIDLKSISVKSIKKLEVESVYIDELILSTIFSLSNYIDKVKSKLNEKDSYDEDERKEIEESLKWIEMSTNTLLRTYLKYYGDVNTVERILEVLKVFNQTSDPQNIPTHRMQIYKILTILQKTLYELSEIIINKNLKKYEEVIGDIYIPEGLEEELSKIALKIEEINELFTLGKTKQALNRLEEVLATLHKTSDFLHTALRYLSIKKDYEELSKYLDDKAIIELNSILANLEEAFLNEDYLLAGDIIYYELLDKIEKLIALVKTVKGMLLREAGKN